METDGGAGHPIGVNIKANPEVKKMFASVANILQESGAGILDLVEHCGADIEPLEKAGVPAFSPIQDGRFYFNYHHTAADTLDKIVPKELAENSAVVAVVAYALAIWKGHCPGKREQRERPRLRIPCSLGQTPQEIRFLHEEARKRGSIWLYDYSLMKETLDSHFQCLWVWNPQTLGVASGWD